jgi:hypothetical protein
VTTVANRAYLYSADRNDVWDRPERDYYDSRWVIPLAWFFFYRPADLQRVDVQFGKSHWQEIKFGAEKVAAVDLFIRRQSLLLSLVENQVPTSAVTHLLEVLRVWPGQFLLLDPEEVLGGMSQDRSWHAERFARSLGLLDSDRPDPKAVLEATYPYVGSLDSDAERRQEQVVGYTYGNFLGDLP